MSKFSKGDKARVTSVNAMDVQAGVKVGDIVIINGGDSRVPFCVLPNGRNYPFLQTQLEHYIEPSKEITINGAIYILKEDPKPEHEWKFGDWARHPEYGVVFVGDVNGPSEIWCIIQDSNGWRYGQHVSPNNLTYISSATIPV